MMRDQIRLTGQFLPNILSIFIILITVAGAVFSASVENVEFQTGHGFYESPFVETLSTETPGATIYYTLDGSDPCTSGSAVTAASPVSITIDPASTYGGLRPITPAVTLKACATEALLDDSDIAVASYVFLDAVINQASGAPGAGWPAPNTGSGQHYDYAMDPSVASAADIKSSLLSAPTISMVTELPNLFDPATGIYENALESGKEWQRAGSIEMIYPDGLKGFQQNCGIRLRGGYSRNDWNPKHSLKVYFDKDYGEKYLEFPLFGDEGVQKYRKIGFRTAQNYSWSMWGDGGDDDSRQNTFLREPLARDIQAAQGHLHAKSFNFHLYMNGMYWGLFMVQEAASAKYARQYLGDDKDLYDVVKAEGGKVEATDGDLTIFNELYDRVESGSISDEAYYALQGLASNGLDKDPSEFHYLDAANLIDYMLAIYYTGDKDSPISVFINNEGINNFYGIISQVNPIGFQWIRHDAEHSFDTGEESRVGPYDLFGKDYFNPQSLHEKLISNNEYRMLFSDLAYKNLYNNGPMTADSVQSMLDRRIAQTEGPITAEAARWGDQKSVNTRTKATWLSAVSVLEDNISTRTNVVNQQLKDIGWFTTVKPPVAVLRSTGATIEDRFLQDAGDANIVEFSPEVSSSTIYYNTGGIDPRAPGGGVSGDAKFGGNRTTLGNAKSIKIRSFHATDGWSPLREIFFVESIGPDVIKFSEVHYKPEDFGGDIDEDAYEFIEIKNTSAEAVSLAGAKFSKGILYTFPAETVLASGEYYVVSKNPGEFARRYGFLPQGHYSDALSNSSETIEMVDAFGAVMDVVEYDDGGAWPESPDGDGPSLNILNVTSATNSNDPANWSASYVLHGTPGIENPATAPHLVSLTVAPTTITVGLGSSVTLVASAIDQYGYPYNTSYTWSTLGNATVIDGLFIAGETGSFEVTVEVEGQTAIATINVQAAPELTTLSITPQNVAVEIGATQQFTVAALDQYGNTFNASVTWSADGGIINSEGVYTATSGGTFTVTATAEALTDNATITVNATPTDVALGKTATASTSEAASLHASMAVDGDPTTRWSSDFLDNEWIAVDLAGEYDITRIVLDWEFAASAHYEIQVSADGVAWTTIVTELNGDGGLDEIAIPVTKTQHVRMLGISRTSVYGHSLYSFEIWGTQAVTIPVLTTIELTPDNAIIIEGATQQYTAVGRDQYGSAIFADFTWSVVGDGAISVDGLVSTTTSGSATISVTAGGVTASTSLTISAIPVLTSIAVSPETSTVHHGGPKQFVARGYDQFGTEVSVSVDWSASGGVIQTDGQYIAYDLGTHTVTATSDAISGTAEITVVDAPVLTSIVVTPSSVNLVLGEAEQFSAEAFDQYGDSFYAEFTWSTTGASAINQDGLWATGVSGTYTVYAETNGIIGSATVTVSENSLIENGDFSDGLTHWLSNTYNGTADISVNSVGKLIVDIINPGTATWNIQFLQNHIPIEAGKKYRYSFDAQAQSNRMLRTAIETDGSPWTDYSKMELVAITTVNDNYSFEFIATETDLDARLVFNMGGTQSDIILDNIVLVEIPIVVDPVLTSIVVTPNTSSILSSETELFAAVGYDQFGDVFTAPIVWSVSGDGSITAAGLYTPVSGGNFTITARSGAVTGTASITVVEPRVLTSLGLTADQTVITVGESVVLTVTPLDQYGDPFTVLMTLTTTSGIITHSINGIVLTGATLGTTVVTATAGSLVENLYIQVLEAPVLSGISLNPHDVSLALNGQQQFVAVGYDQYGETIATPFTWSATAGSITSLGLYTASESGIHTVTVESGVFSATVTVDVSSVPINVALNKPVTVSSEESSNQRGEFAVDGLGNTRWSSLHSNNQSIEIDLEGEYDITSVTLDWETAAAQHYVIQVKTADNSSWQTIHTTTNGNGGTDVRTVSATKVTDIRMFGYTRTTIYGFSLYEFEVMGTPSVTVPPALSGVTITPKTVTLTIGEQAQFTGTAIDQYGAPYASPVTYSANCGTIDANGLFTATVEGTCTVTAATSVFISTAVVTVVAAPELTSIALTPNTEVEVLIGETQQYTVQTVDQFGNSYGNITTAWSLAGACGSLDNNGLFTATAEAIVGACEVNVVVTDNNSGVAFNTSVFVIVTDFVPVNMLSNGDFSNGMNGWSLGVYGSASATHFVNGGEGVIEINNGGTASWNVQFQQGNLNMQNGKHYRMSFYGRATSARNIGAKVEKASSPYSSYGGSNNIALTTTKEYIEYDFVMSGNDPVARIAFNLGTNSSDVILSDIQVVELP